MDSIDVIRELLEMHEQHPHEQEAAKDRATMGYLYGGGDFYDNISGKWLDKDLAIEARRLELEFFREMGVYTKVPRAAAGDSKVITTNG